MLTLVTKKANQLICIPFSIHVKGASIYSIFILCFYLFNHTSCCTLDTGSLFEGETRSDAILIHGVNEMSTEDVFAYFRDFAPGSVEWIDDSSCKSLISVI